MRLLLPIHQKQLAQPVNCPILKEQFLFMKKKLLIGGVALLTTAAVTATVLTTNHKKNPRDVSKTEMKKSHCSKASKSACY